MLGVHEPERGTDFGVIERGRGRLLADFAEHDAVVFATDRHIGVRGVRHLHREVTQTRLEHIECIFRALELALELRGVTLSIFTLVRRRAPDLLRDRLLAGAQLFHLRALCARLRIETQDLIDQAFADALAFDARAVLRVIAQAAEVDHGTWVTRRVLDISS